MWQLETVVFLQWCLMRAVLLPYRNKSDGEKSLMSSKPERSLSFLRSRASETWNNGQTLANRTKPGPSFQLWIWACIHVDKYMHIINLWLKTRPKDVLGSLLLAFALPTEILHIRQILKDGRFLLKYIKASYKPQEECIIENMIRAFSSCHFIIKQVTSNKSSL